MGMATAATVTAVASKNPKSTNQATSTPLQQKTATATPTPTPTPTSGGGGGGGGKWWRWWQQDGGGGGGRGDGGGNDAGNAGSGLFDSPLATKARRRANDFDNADREDDDDRIFVDVDPDGESVYGTDSVSFTTGPDGLEIQTDNISYSAQPTPTPEPLPRLELPTREPGFPFGEDFPFGNTTVTIGQRRQNRPIPVILALLPPRAEPIPARTSRPPTATAGTIRWISRVERGRHRRLSPTRPQPDELLSTTRSVRRRLDLRARSTDADRAVPDLAQQAPSGAINKAGRSSS